MSARLGDEAAAMNPAAPYGPDYYASHCGDQPYARRTSAWVEFYERISTEIIRSLMPRRVFDAGCAIAFLVEALWDRGVEAYERDISPQAISQVRADVRPYCAEGSIADPVEGEYDLVLCIEVLEHMPESEALRAIQSITAAAPRVLFSSSPVDLDERTHINVRPTIYWLRRFAEAGFAPVPGHDASFVSPHAMLLERSESGRDERSLRAFAEIVRQRLALIESKRQVDALERRAAEAEAARAGAEAKREAEAEARAHAEAARDAEAEARKRAEAAISPLKLIYAPKPPSPWLARRKPNAAEPKALSIWKRPYGVQTAGVSAARHGGGNLRRGRCEKLQFELFAARSPGATATVKDAKLILKSPLFDVAWYAAGQRKLKGDRLDIALHYLKKGAAKGCNPQ